MKIRGNTVGTTTARPDWNQNDPNKADYIRNKPTIPSKVSELENDSKFIAASGAPVQSVNGKTGAVTLNADDVGARADDWMPTAAEVGARADDWMPTAADVGARPENWMPTATEVGARADSWTPTAAEVGARPDNWMPTAAEVGALPDTYTPPNQTAEQVGADPSGTAAGKVSAHNTNTGAHSDIRLLISALTSRLDALANSDDTTLDQMAEVVEYIKDNRELIEQITTGKVSVTDIINNLTTNVSNKPLSAAQGVAIKALIDGLSTGKLDASKLTEAINTALAQAKTSGEFDGKDGDPGTSVTVKSVSESTADGGSNVVTFSDGKKITIKNIKTYSNAFFNFLSRFLDTEKSIIDISDITTITTATTGIKLYTFSINPIKEST